MHTASFCSIFVASAALKIGGKPQNTIWYYLCSLGLYQERERDIEFKRIIEDLSISLKPWTTVCWVGNIGLYYDFSPQVLAGICERRQAAKAKRELAALASSESTKITC
jgi:hypothetical protein